VAVEYRRQAARFGQGGEEFTDRCRRMVDLPDIETGEYSFAILTGGSVERACDVATGGTREHREVSGRHRVGLLGDLHLAAQVVDRHQPERVVRGDVVLGHAVQRIGSKHSPPPDSPTGSRPIPPQVSEVRDSLERDPAFRRHDRRATLVAGHRYERPAVGNAPHAG
jgi:hypothetical protein